jgi:phospholipase D1/2
MSIIITSNFYFKRIALRIRNRIERAYKNNEKFRVFIFLPLQPAFPGEITESHTLHLIMKYTYKTISRNKGLSLLEKLHELMKDKIDDYISFFSLRTHGLLNDKPVTELIYIHSKLMLVDDEYAIIGSANINDRSMIGHRDSEIGVLINSEYKTEVVLDGRNYKVSENVKNLRIKLMKVNFFFNSGTSRENLG